MPVKKDHSMFFTYLRRCLNLEEPDELVKILDESKNFNKLGLLDKIRQPVTYRGMKLVGVYRAALKDDEAGLFVNIRFYRTDTTPYFYHAAWTYGNSSINDGLLNIRNKSIDLFTIDQFENVVEAIVSTMKGIAAIHKPYTAR